MDNPIGVVGALSSLHLHLHLSCFQFGSKRSSSDCVIYVSMQTISVHEGTRMAAGWFNREEQKKKRKLLKTSDEGERLNEKVIAIDAL